MVGLGGASFPTWFKMCAPEGKSFEFLVVNGMECEPYITSDYRQMMEHTERVVDGVFRTIEALEIPAAVIGVEDNKPEAILELQRVVKEKGREDRIEVMSIPTKYPAGGEKVLIKATTGRHHGAAHLAQNGGGQLAPLHGNALLIICLTLHSSRALIYVNEKRVTDWAPGQTNAQNLLHCGIFCAIVHTIVSSGMVRVGSRLRSFLLKKRGM